MTRVAFMDVWASAVREEVRRAAPAQFELGFAQSYDADHQRDLARDAEVIVPGFATVDAALLEGAPRLRLVHKWGVGLDAIDGDALCRRGVALAVTRGANAGPVAELTVALMLAVYRRIPFVDRAIREGGWPTPQMRETCYQIAGKTVGLVGFGAIGRMVARRLAGFEARLVYFDPQPADASTEAALHACPLTLDQLLSSSDIVSLHLPLTPATRHLIDAEAIARMKDGAVLINTARGELVDEGALAGALRRGKLRGAGLDAFEHEPPPVDHPLLAPDLNVVLTPHVGGGVFDNVAAVARHVFANVQRFLRGEALPAADLVIGPSRAARP